MIRDREHICNLHLPSKHGIIGKDFSIALDFTECVQECSVVRAVLIASELRPDDSRIQVRWRILYLKYLGVVFSYFLFL